MYLSMCVHVCACVFQRCGGEEGGGFERAAKCRLEVLHWFRMNKKEMSFYITTFVRYTQMARVPAWSNYQVNGLF